MGLFNFFRKEKDEIDEKELEKAIAEFNKYDDERIDGNIEIVGNYLVENTPKDCGEVGGPEWKGIKYYNRFLLLSGFLNSDDRKERIDSIVDHSLFRVNKSELPDDIREKLSELVWYGQIVYA